MRRLSTTMLALALAGCGGGNGAADLATGSHDLARSATPMDMTTGGACSGGGTPIAATSWTLTAEYKGNQLCQGPAPLAAFDIDSTVTAPFTVDAQNKIVAGAAATGAAPTIANLSCCPAGLTCDTPTADAPSLASLAGAYDPCTGVLTITMMSGSFVDFPAFAVHSAGPTTQHAQTVEMWQSVTSALGGLKFPAPHDGQMLSYYGKTPPGMTGPIFTLHTK